MELNILNNFSDTAESNKNEDESDETDFEEERLQLLALEIEILESDGNEDFQPQRIKLIDNEALISKK